MIVVSLDDNARSYSRNAARRCRRCVRRGPAADPSTSSRSFSGDRVGTTVVLRCFAPENRDVPVVIGDGTFTGERVMAEPRWPGKGSLGLATLVEADRRARRRDGEGRAAVGGSPSRWVDRHQRTTSQRRRATASGLATVGEVEGGCSCAMNAATLRSSTSSCCAADTALGEPGACAPARSCSRSTPWGVTNAMVVRRGSRGVARPARAPRYIAADVRLAPETPAGRW